MSRPCGVVEGPEQDAVVGRDEGVVEGADGDGAAVRAHARIDDDAVHGAGREVSECGAEEPCGFDDVLRRDGVGDVDDVELRVDREDRPFHGGDVDVVGAEVGQEGDDAGGLHDRDRINTAARDSYGIASRWVRNISGCWDHWRPAMKPPSTTIA